MIIDRVLHVRSSKMDFYSLSYLRDPFALTDGSLLFFGKELPPAIREATHPSFVDGAIKVVEKTNEGVLVERTIEYYKAYEIDFKDATKTTLVVNVKREDLYEGELYLHQGKLYLIQPRENFDPAQFHLFHQDETEANGLHITTSYYNHLNGGGDYRMYNGRFYWKTDASGTEVKVHVTAKDYKVPVVLDIREYLKDHPDWTLPEDCIIEHPDGYCVERPVIPPMLVWVDDNEQRLDSYYTDYWLGFYNGCTPNIISPLKHDDIRVFKNYTTYPWTVDPVKVFDLPHEDDDPLSKITENNQAFYRLAHDGSGKYIELTCGELDEYFELQEVGEGYKIYAPDPFKKVYIKDVDKTAVTFQYRKYAFDLSNTVPVVNGFVCFPENTGYQLKALNSAQYIQNLSDRDRQFVLIDFSPVGGCECRHLSECEGDLKEFVLPSDLEFDTSTHSLLLVVDGRLILPLEYTVIGNHVITLKSLDDVASELDRKACSNLCADRNRRLVIADGDRDRFNNENSFVIVVPRPNLQTLYHDAWYKSSESKLKQGNNSYAALDKNQFYQNARGLLYDRTTRSIVDYSREEHTATFYADDPRSEAKFRTSTVTVVPERPLVLLTGSTDNLMSAKAAFFDNPNDFVHDDRVLWPIWTIVDLIFRG